eukprot:gene4448-7823_t
MSFSNLSQKRIEGIINLNEKYQSFVNNNKFSDIKFLIGPELIEMSGHKFIISSSCSYFEKMFKEEKDLIELIYTDISPITFYEFLYFIYCGKTSDTMDYIIIIELLELSLKFEIKLLEQWCLNIIELYSNEILNCNEFLNLSKESLIKLLKSDHFKIENEFKIFKKCLKWSKNNKKLLNEILPYIRFTIIDINLLEEIEEYFNNDLLLSIYKNIYFKKFENPRNSIQFKYEKDFDTNGILYYIGSKEGKYEWSNPMKQNLVSVSCWGQNKINGDLSTLVGRNDSDLWIESTSICAFQIDLKNYSVLISSFTLKHFSQSCCYPISFKIEGSNNGIEWITIQVFIDPNLIFHEPNESKTFRIQNSNQSFFRFFRILNFQKNSDNWNFGIGAFEMYGRLNKFKN